MSMVKLGALWKRKNKEGKTFLAGNIGAEVSILVFSKEKTADNQPDYEIFIAKNEQRQQGQHSQKPKPPPQDDSF